MLIRRPRVSAACYWIVNCMQYYSLFKNGISESGGRTLMLGGQHHDSLSVTMYGFATPPVHISASNGNEMPQLLLHPIDDMLVHVLPRLTGICSLISMPSCAPSGDVPMFYQSGQCTLLSRCHREFGRWHQLNVVRVFGTSTWPVSAWGYSVAGSKFNSWEEPRSSELSQTSGVYREVLLWVCPVLVVVAVM